MTYTDEQQAIAYERAALNCMLDRTLGDFFDKLASETKGKSLSRNQMQVLRLGASKGIPSAQRLLADLGNNLPR